MAGMIFLWSPPSCWRVVLVVLGLRLHRWRSTAIFALTFGCEFPALGKLRSTLGSACRQRKMGHWRTVSRRRRAVLYPRSVSISRVRNTPKASA